VAAATAVHLADCVHERGFHLGRELIEVARYDLALEDSGVEVGLGC
jgi:hypothetical protein